MESLPDDILQHILSRIDNVRDVAYCHCVSKRWNELIQCTKRRYIPFRYFYEQAFDLSNIVKRIVSNAVCLEELIVPHYFLTLIDPTSWLLLVPPSLRHIEIQMRSPRVIGNTCIKYWVPLREFDFFSRLNCVPSVARNLKSLKVCCGIEDVLLKVSPNWGVFQNLKNLEITSAVILNPVFALVLQSCPFLTRFSLDGCTGVTSVFIDLQFLEHCKLNFFDPTSFCLILTSPKIESLEVRNCNQIRVTETKHLRKLSVCSFSGSINMVDFGNLAALEFLSMSGKCWCWDSLCKLLNLATELKHLYVNVDALQPFREMDFVDFFNNHKKLHTFDIDETMFAAVCSSLKYVDSRFVIPILEEVVIVVRSPAVNTQLTMDALESLLKYGKSLRTMIIKISKIEDHIDYIDVFTHIFYKFASETYMKSKHDGTADFFDMLLRFRSKNRNIVRIE